ncbi:serine hydrolase domain-containing protein [Actinomadura atramentaria]|uniref:serine hydrolase domain-containing protein n=1 Tax=Actinomadura atramentaria TaxID=1990 RepID=UPI00036326A9|nr:serine hydrolase [Actinomadura atramentaria]
MRWRRIAIASAAAVAVVVGGSYAGTSLLAVPPPHTLYRLLTTPTSQVGGLYPARRVPASAHPLPFAERPGTLPATVPWKGRQITVAQFLETTKSRAFLVVRDGALVHEWYADGVRPTDRMASWSVAKSIVSLLVGQAIGEGRLREDDRVADLIPAEHVNPAVRVRDLLDMASGIDVPENYREYWPFTGTARMYLTQDLPGFVRDHNGLEFTPGSKGEYRSVNTQILGMILAKVEGKPLSELLGERLWGPIGAQDDATWNLDHDGGIEKAFCCVNATARDFAKIGRLVLDNGRAADHQIVPAAWIKRISTPAPHRVSEWQYSAQWWHPGHGAHSALGVYGQYVYTDPATNTVIVKLSDYGDEQDEQQTFDVLHTISTTDLTTRPAS